ncbi:TIGR03013 family XrtA/PEP-CTERM system glycosyltransferase [Dankookia sp. GCM10030260]|uniref:TIGR03013 family XrtA/PEP-CTERM system glycosyltransferase n=1 Tax=Dankookia sp. GCM10030260 TaxID=3273390 RepID=UPI00361BFCB4
MVTPSRAGLAAGPVLVLLDTAFALIAWPVALWLALSLLSTAPWPRLPAAALHPLACVLMLFALGLYRRDALQQTRRSLGRAPFAVLLGGAGASVLAALLPEPFGVAQAGLLFAAAVPCFTLTAFAARVLLFLLRRREAFRRRLVIIGAGQRAFDLILLLRRESGTLGYDVGLIRHPVDAAVDPRLAEMRSCSVLSVDAGILAAVREFGTDQIVVAPDDRRGLPMEALLACRTSGYPVHEYLPFLENEIGRIDIKRIELGWLLYADGFHFRPLDLALKRALDIGAAALLLLLAGPVLLAACVAVRAEDGGPALYRQSRVTRGGRVFRIMKLRTMRMDAEKFGAVYAQARDPRITRIGNFLRRTRIDELPQLLNVLRGDMSFVGPRPERPEFTADLGKKLPLYEERHLVRAGLTGWAQVNYPYGASLDDSRSKLSYDLYYVKNFGVLFDILIILQTLRVVLWPGNTVR